jgi:D-serine deaminase-like pyridoxal phosphate-dependent protein
MHVAKETRVSVGLDDLGVAQGLSGAARQAGLEIGVLAEANLGMNRMGVEPGDDLVTLARGIAALPNLRFEGVEFYYGHVNHSAPNWEELLAGLIRDVQQIREDFDRAGIELKLISGGSTPMVFHSHEIEGMNEIRPGTYVFNDVMQVGWKSASWEDCAVTIMTTVISAARQGFAIIDGGSKTFTSDPAGAGGDPSFGRVTEAPESRFYQMNEEHGYLEMRGAPEPVRVGDRLRIIPNHVCAAVNMHEYVYGIRGEEVEQVWKVEARGKLQ